MFLVTPVRREDYLAAVELMMRERILSRPKTKNAARGGILIFAMRWGLDTDAELCRLLIAGIGVEVVGRALVELVAQANLTAHVEAEGGDGHADGEPSDNLEGLALLLIVEECQIAG